MLTYKLPSFATAK